MTEIKRGRGRPKGSTSGSIYGSDSTNSTTHITDQIRHGKVDSEGNITLKHHDNGKVVKISKKICDAFYDCYHNTAKPSDKNEKLRAFGERFFGLPPKNEAKKITLSDAVARAEKKRIKV